MTINFTREHLKGLQDTVREIIDEQYCLYNEHRGWLDEYSDWLENQALQIVDNNWIYDIICIIADLEDVLDEQQSRSNKVWEREIKLIQELIDEQTGNE